MMLDLFAQLPTPAPTPGISDVAFQYMVQGGFAVFSVVLLYVLWHTVQSNNKTRDDRENLLITVIKDNNAVILGNTAVLEKLSERGLSTERTLLDVRDRLLERPCLLPRRAGGEP